MVKIATFEESSVWQKAHEFVLTVYDVTKRFPKAEQYALTDQLRRAAISIEANIAECFGRFHFSDKINFLYNARGSLEETKSLIRTSKDLGYLGDADYPPLRHLAERIGGEINRFIAALRDQKRNVMFP